MNLQELSLIGCGLTSLDGFPPLPALKKLLISDNRIAGGLEALSGCTGLVELSLASNRIATLEDLEPLKQLPVLRVLDFEGCPVADTEDVFEYRQKAGHRNPVCSVLVHLWLVNTL